MITRTLTKVEVVPLLKFLAEAGKESIDDVDNVGELQAFMNACIEGVEKLNIVEVDLNDVRKGMKL